MPVDRLTKNLSYQKFEHFRSLLNLGNIYVSKRYVVENSKVEGPKLELVEDQEQETRPAKKVRFDLPKKL